MTVQAYVSGWREETRRGQKWFVPELAVEGESYTVIDLRPDKTSVDGLCLFARVDDGSGNALPSRPGVLTKIGAARRGDRGDKLGPVARRLLGNKLGIDLSSAADVQEFFSEVLFNGPAGGKINGGRPIIVPTQNLRHEAFLGGEKIIDVPAIGGGFSDSFTYSDGDLSTVGSANWADVVGTVQVSGNLCQNTAAFNFDVAKYKTAMSSGDHYAQANAKTLTGSSGAYNFLGVRIRQDNTTDNAIHFEAGWAAGTTQSELNLLVFTAGTPTAIGNWISTDQVTGYPMPARPFTIKVVGNGSTLDCYAGAYGPADGLTVTDSTFSTNTYVGIMCYTEGGTSLAQLDDFVADINSVSKSTSDSGSGTNGTAQIAVSTSQAGGGAEGTPTLSVTTSTSQTGAGTEGTPSIAVSTSQTGSGADAVSLTVSQTTTDSGTGVDAVSLTASVSTSQTGSGSDAVSLTASATLAATGSGAEGTPSIAVSTSETGSGSDTPSPAKTLTDTGSGTDATTNREIQLLDSGSGADSHSLFSGSNPTTTDAGSGVDAVSLSASMSSSETGTGADAQSLTANVSTSQTGSGSDAVSLAVSILLAQTGTGSDVLASLAVAATLAESGTASNETISVPGVGTPVSTSDTGRGYDQVFVVGAVRRISYKQANRPERRNYVKLGRKGFR